MSGIRLRSRPVIDKEGASRDLATLAVPLTGSVESTGDPWLPFRLLDPAGVRWRRCRRSSGTCRRRARSEATLRSHGMDLLRWFRFLWAIEVIWNRATRVEARDFCRWLLVAGKPARPHWRSPGEVPQPRTTAQAYAPSVRAHSETVLSGFYGFHLDEGSGPLVNPFPLDRARRGRRAHAHHNPMEPHRNARTGLYRPTVPKRVPRSVPDAEFNEIFARLPSHRDRALVAFYISTAARASELLSVTQGGVEPGRQLITVVRKGSRAEQALPASSDAFVWLRLYQVEMEGLIPKGRRLPLWWTLRRPLRPLTYHAVHRMFERAAAAAGSTATLHALRHTAAYRMAEDPELPLTDIQLVLGHAAHHDSALPDPAPGRRDPASAGPPRRTAARTRLHQPGNPGELPGQAVLGRPRAAPPRHRQPAPCGRGRRQLEATATDVHEDHPLPGRPDDRDDCPSDQLPRMPDSSSGVLPRPGALGGGRPSSLGP